VSSTTEVLERRPRASAAPHAAARKRIALLTPYNGGNLGDGAIMHTVLTHIRRRMPAAEIVGVTLSPADTTARHGIDALPLTGIALATAALSAGRKADDRPAAAPSAASPPLPGTLERIKAAVKESPALYRATRPLHVRVAALAFFARRIAADVRHTAMAFDRLGRIDLMVFSGGGQLDDYWRGPWGHPYAMFKWTLLARLRGVKVAFLSVGVGSIESPLTRLFFRGSLGLAHYRSYRDAGSKRLVGFVLATRADAVVPDLAFGFPREEYLAADDGAGRPADGRRPVIGISPIAYLFPEYWPKQQAGVYERYMGIMVDFARTLIERGHPVVLFSSASPDRRVAEELRRRLVERLGGTARNLTVTLPENVDQFLRCVREVDLVVASRLHGILLSHILRKPVLAVSYDRKVDVHMRELGQTGALLDIHDFRLDDLQAAFARLEAESRTVTRVIQAQIDGHQAALNRQFDEALAL
jgi:polysaccharide pyruvyl transferase WcaK-like protein